MESQERPSSFPSASEPNSGSDHGSNENSPNTAMNAFLQNLVTAEAQAWELSDREAEVWRLRRSGLSYKQIADELFITLNTVKRHLKNIKIKLRLTYLDALDEKAGRLNPPGSTALITSSQMDPLADMTLEQQAESTQSVGVKNPDVIYRFILPTGKSSQTRREFERSIDALKQANPEWLVTPDMPRSNEEAAVIVTRKDENFISRQLTYLITSSLSQNLHSAYGSSY